MQGREIGSSILACMPVDSVACIPLFLQPLRDGSYIWKLFLIFCINTSTLVYSDALQCLRYKVTLREKENKILWAKIDRPLRLLS